MAAAAPQCIVDRQGPARTIERETPFMNDGAAQPLIAIVSTVIHGGRVVGVEFEVLGLRFLEHAKQPLGLELVLLLAIDDKRIVSAGGSEPIARVGIRRVDKASGIDNQRAAAV